MLPGHHPDAQYRVQAFHWLEEQVRIHGDVLPRALLAEGFGTPSGERVRFLGPQGIFKPRAFRLPLSITTAPGGPYDDAFGPDGCLHYRYRGTDPMHRDNVGLREAGRGQVPLVYLHGIVPGKYLAVWPVFIVGDDPATLTFRVMADDRGILDRPFDAAALRDSAKGRRQYVTSTVQRRLHQRGFRERVLQAYRDQCTICRLKHPELLDAAHIIPDGEPDGLPVVPNGLSLCKLHHAAYDKMVLGISPDYEVVIRRDVLEEIDGPMLKHGLVELHGQRLILPRHRSDRPDRGLLERRYIRFRDRA